LRYEYNYSYNYYNGAVDEVEIHNNPNLHFKEQDELEIPDCKEFIK
jgi:hypothetical protein